MSQSGNVGNADSVTGNLNYWRTACEEASTNDEKFLIFRSTLPFMQVVEGSPKESGLWNLDRLLRCEIFRSCLPFLQLNEGVGLPQNLISFTARGGNYSLSPTTIRYANNAVNVINFFGIETLRAGSIHEIGSGYGGEAAVFNHFSRTLGNCSIGDRWNIYDLPSSHQLIVRFLRCLNYSARIKIDLESVGVPELVISNGALSEMWGATFDQYMSKVVAPAKCGYFMTNFESHSAPNGGITTSRFLDILKSLGKKGIANLSLSRYLSKFDERAGTRLVVFGAESYPPASEVSSGFRSELFRRGIIGLDRVTRFVERKYLAQNT